MTELGEDKQSVLEELGSKHVAKQLDCILKLLASTRFFGVENDKERVHIAHFFQSSYHYFNVSGIPIL
jgi:hypothetical protein